jgi:hypothetical protein
MIATLPRPIPESYWVISDRFLAGEYPGSWDHDRTIQRMDLFLEAGFDTFIDLTSEGELLPYAPILAERAAYYSILASHQRFSIGDFGVPSVEQMKKTLDTLDAALQDSRKVYVHCWGGVGRTGTTVGCYLARHGNTGEQALAQLAEWWQHVPKHNLHPRSPETDEQVKFILGWEKGQ